MKKRMFITIVAMLFSVTAFAQQAAENNECKRAMPSVEQIAKWKADRLREQLLLGADQYDEVYKLCLAQAEKDMARMKEMKAEKEQMAADMKGILNDAQYERFVKMQQGFHHKRPQHPQRPHHPQPRKNFEPCDKHNGCKGEACDKTQCGKCAKCDDKKCDDKKCEAPAEMQVEASAEAPKIKRGQRLRMPAADRRHNKNAYIYIEDSATEE